MSSGEFQTLFSKLQAESRQRTADSPVPMTHTQQSSRPSSSTFFHPAQNPSTPPPALPAFSGEKGFVADTSMHPTRSASGATAQNLLNLLNFGGPQGNVSTPTQPPIDNVARAPTQTQNASISASDLVAKFMSPTATTPKPEHNDDSGNATRLDGSATRNQLLELLNKQATAGLGPRVLKEQDDLDIHPADVPVESVEEPTSTVVDAIPEQYRDTESSIFKALSSPENTTFEPLQTVSPKANENKPIFTYTNPFEALNASRPQEAEISTLESSRDHDTVAFNFSPVPNMSSPDAISARKKLTPRLRSQRSITPANAEQSPVLAQPEGNLNISSDEPPAFEKTQEHAKGFAAAPEPAEDDGQLTYNKEIPHAGKDQTGALGEDVDGSGEWEDAEDSPDKVAVSREVPVYNFPIKAFVSITLHLGASSEIDVREDGVMEISRLKKDFDQLDRSLAAATAKYITYAFPKNGGMRIIRQDDGSDRHVFKNSHDRIFNVAFCAAANNSLASESQAVLGTGVSGAVYYANVSKEGNDLFEKNQLDSESLIFPPYPQADENTAGGVLKTRAKRSSRHPEFFAIGRGKLIQIVWPATALSPRYGISDISRTVDVEKFYSDRPLQVSTGKAGKDFTFSEDDTMIVSLDKTGRLRFWDITALTDESTATAARVKPMIVETPVLSLSTASPTEKSWPTSVTFVDKSRPYKKGGPLRYVLVGLRQNHTLQLWDIALGKAVQELNFPHENETDGICSVNYHPESGIIVVSHPTRNSIFFIHLSAPKYTLSPQISQTSYVQRVAAKDPELPKPESTACMSGIREISFAQKGQLRSVELLHMKKTPESSKDESVSLFELYVVHSKGVTCLGINREDLGWNMDNKVLYPVDAQQENIVSLKELKLGTVIEEPIRSKSPVKEVQQPAKTGKKKAKKASPPSGDANGIDEIQQMIPSTPQAPVSSVLEPADAVQPEPVVQETAIPKESKKSKKKSDKASQANEQGMLQQENSRAISPTKAFPIQTNGKSESFNEQIKSTRTEAAPVGIPADWLDKELPKIENAVANEFKKEFDLLYKHIQDDRAAQESSSASRQEAILRLVSSTLSNNVEKSLSRILAQQMQQSVVPAVVQQAFTSVSEILSQQLHQTLPSAIGTNLTTAVTDALQTSMMDRSIADSMSQKLSKQIESQINEAIFKNVTPMLKSIAITAAEKASADTENRLNLHIRQLQIDRATDKEKLDKLGTLLQGIAGTLQTMSDSQVAFQGQILKDRQSLAMTSTSNVAGPSRQVSTARGTPDPTPAPKSRPMRIRSKAEIELDEITNLMNEGRYEEGSIKWLQSTQPVKLFDELFVRFTPEYLSTDVSPLVAFSVAVTVANSLETNTERRLEWISAAFNAVDLQDSEISDLSQHAPALITSLIQKLESLYMTIAEQNPGDSILKTIPSLAKKGKDMRANFIAKATGSIPATLSQITATNF